MPSGDPHRFDSDQTALLALNVWGSETNRTNTANRAHAAKPEASRNDQPLASRLKHLPGARHALNARKNPVHLAQKKRRYQTPQN